MILAGFMSLRFYSRSLRGNKQVYGRLPASVSCRWGGGRPRPHRPRGGLGASRRPRGQTAPPSGRAWALGGCGWASPELSLHRRPSGTPEVTGLCPRAGVPHLPQNLGGLVAAGSAKWGATGPCPTSKRPEEASGPHPAGLGHQRTHWRVAGVGTSTEPPGTPSPEGALLGTAPPGPTGGPPR